MLFQRAFQRLNFILSQRGNTSLKSLTTASNVVRQKDDAIVKMENPYKESYKGCILCSVTVDYKNIQTQKIKLLNASSSAAVSVHLPSHRQDLRTTHHRPVWEKTKGNFKSYKESSLAGFYVSDTQTSTVHE
ncbi:28S ribosomal protein S18c, mitochondrial isoform X1 [Betta splendens]|uniref:28S ribosomal protein S18c, mitochondrial isoform X1 n=1 Tax=Betta splendens TaxID=158456 RepID=A0A6P7NYD9_BETSP|nr:28S ribosomal protein S18c, mitochondrial isoform X1 [Betta splendens]